MLRLLVEASTAPTTSLSAMLLLNAALIMAGLNGLPGTVQHRNRRCAGELAALLSALTSDMTSG